MNMSKCRGKLCANCTEEYCEVVLNMEIGEEIFEEDEIVDGEVGMFDEMEWCDDYGEMRDGRMFDYYEGCWR